MDKDKDIEAKSILIVDDSKTIRALVKSFLKNEPYSIVEASNGREALSKMQESSFDLVITDIMMPEMNGFKLLEKIEEIHAGTKVIAISGVGGKMTANSVLRGLKRLGVRNTLSKPFDDYELIALVEEVLSQ